MQESRHVTQLRKRGFRILVWGSVAIATSLGIPGTIQAQTPLPTTGTPGGNRTGGGTRPELTQNCPTTPQFPTALVPEESYGRTAIAYPTFWFFIPFTHSDVDRIEFVILNWDETQTIYRQSVELTDRAGIYHINLPEQSDLALEVDELYHWYLTIDCVPKALGEPSDFVLDGWIERSPTLTSNTELPWYDRVTQLATQCRNNPPDLEWCADWEMLLESVGLESLGTAPFGN